jgi:hypothetical protein
LSERIVSTTLSSRSVRRAARATAAPRRARASAVASPMPLEAPVTSAAVPSSVSFWMLWSRAEIRSAYA